MKTLSLILAFFLMPHLVAQICNAASVFPTVPFQQNLDPVPTETREETLFNFLTYPNCVTACWLGIQSLMPESEMVEILNTNHIQFNKQEIGDSGFFFTYEVVGGYTNPYLKPEFLDSIVIYVDGEKVVGIDIRLSNAAIDNVIAAFGAPTSKTVDGEISLAYPQWGLAFSVNANEAYTAHLRSKTTIEIAYIEGSEVLPPCTEATQLCAVATATSIPVATSTPLPSTGALSDLLTHPDCLSACWLGIGDSTTEVEIVEILNANNIQYEKKTFQSVAGFFSYEIIGGYAHPNVIAGYRDSIVIFVRDGLGGGIYITLSNTSIDDVIATFGAPDAVSDDRGEVSLLYIEEGLAFSVNQNEAYMVKVLNKETILRAFINDPFSKPFTACPETAQLCGVATATSMP